MEATYLLAAGVLLITYILFKLRQRSLNFSTFHQLGIPGPEPSFLWGNLPEINSKGIGVCMVQWYRQYGEIFGVYLGARPFLFIANPDVLRDFLVKDFNNFTDKDLFLEGFGGDDKRVELVLEGLRGEAWKALRMKLSPTFSTGKLRQMRPFVLTSWAELEQKLPSGRTVDIGALTASAVMDISISVFAGIKEPVQEQPNSRLSNAIREAMAISFSDLPIILAMSFPSLAPLLFRLAIWSTQLNGEKSSLKFLLDMGDHIYRQRLKMPEVQRKDVLQLLIDYNRDAAKTNDGSKPMLSDDEIVMNAITFIFGGYDTTAVTLKFALHTLAHHQDVQDKVREEVRKVQGDKDIFDPDDVGKLTYMEQVLSEVLRLYPPSPMSVQRLASKDYEVNGKKIPKSIPFIVALDALHRSEKYWDNPEEFDPERFSPEQKANIPAFVYQPFGAGPRMCIGMRMANMVDKALLALILSKFRLVASSETDKEKPQLRDTMFVLHPKLPVKVQLERLG